VNENETGTEIAVIVKMTVDVTLIGEIVIVMGK
jgi:hypothetical protein